MPASLSCLFLLSLLLAFVSGVAGGGALLEGIPASISNTTNTTRQLQDENDLVGVDECASVNAVSFTSYLLVSGLLLFQVERDASAAPVHDLLVSTLIDAYNDHSETGCGQQEKRGGTTIGGARVLLEEDGDVLLEVDATCVGCSFESDLFLFTNTITMMDDMVVGRAERNNNTMGTTHQQSSCYCEPQLRAMFANTLQEALIMQGIVLEHPDIVFDVAEVSVPVSCDSVGDVVNLTEVVLVDFKVNCSLIDSDSAILANAFVNIYNEISKKDYCDPYFRQLVSARVIRRGGTRSEEGALTIELELIGTCRGCDPEVDGFYDPLVDISADDNFININKAINTKINSIDTNNTVTNNTDFNTTDTNSSVIGNSSSSTRRSLVLDNEKNDPFERSNRQVPQQELGDETCYCPLESVAARAPSEAEVMDAFRHHVQTAAMAGLLRCVTSIGQCQFGTIFESNFLVAFSNSNTTIDFASQIELSLQDTLNDLFTPRVGICKPEFRLVQSVTSTIGVVLDEDEILLRRQLQMDDMTSHKRRTQDTSFEPVKAPTSLAPSTLLTPSQTEDLPSFLSTPSPSNIISGPSSTPTLAPTIEFPGSLLVILRVTGVCNGCTSDFLLGNQVSAGVRRNLSDRHQTKDSIFDASRLLQLYSIAPDSSCYCPIESVVQEGSSPSEEIVLDEYQERLERSAVNLNVQSFQEVQIINCEDEIGIFDTQLTLRVTLNQDVSDGELRRLANLVEETYNELTDEMYCDPLIRRVENMDVDSMTLVSSSGQDGCDLYEVTFEVRGDCRGCEDDSSLFFQGDEDERRRLNNDIPGWARVDRNGSNHYYNNNASRKRKRRHRRRLQGSELCLCEGYTVGNRAPSLGEFEEVLEEAIKRARFDLICGLSSQFQEVPITDVPSTSPSSVPSESPTACTASLENEFSTELILFVEEDGSNVVDEDVRILLGESIQTAYNELSQAHYRVCDSLYREVISISPAVLPEDEGTRRNLLRVKDKKTTQFGNHHTNLPSRKLQEASGSGIPVGYIVSGRCESCGPDSNIFDALTGDQVISRVKALSAMFMDSGVLLDMQEIENIECSSDIVEFDEVVIVELVATCPEDADFGFDDVLTTAIEETFVATYNALTALYCDEYFTVLVDAELENVGVITEDGNIPIEIRVFAECLGCDPQRVGIYGNPSAIQRTSSNNVSNRNLQTGSGKLEHTVSLNDPVWRFLQNTNRDSCICSAQAVADQPPSESEFIAAFRENVEALPLDCVSSVGECQFGSTFDTDIVLTFEGNQTSLTEEVRVAIQENFLILLNNLFEPDEDVCNPDFRVVVDVAVVFDFTLNGEFIELGGNDTSSDKGLAGGERNLQEDVPNKGSPWSRKNQASNNDSIVPSTSLTTVFDVGSSNQNDPSISPTSSPTIDFDTNLIRTLLTVTGVCNGCGNELFLSNQVLTVGRKLQEQERNTHEFERSLHERSLESRNSNCFCPLTAILNIEPPSSEEIQGALSRRLEEEEIELVVRNIDTVSAIACDDEEETTQFKSEFTIAFSALETVPDAEIQKLGDTIAAVYNGLVEDYCDPLIRRKVVLKLKDRNRVITSSAGEKKRLRRDLQNNEDGANTDLPGVDPPPNCVNYEATFEVRGKCRGCDDGTPLLDGSNGNRRSLEVHNRILSSGGRTERTRRRHLMEVDEECFCDANTIAPRAPTLDELWLRLELELGSFVEVCGRPVDCDPTQFVSQFSETTILALLLERGTVLTEEHLLELELAYMSGYNEMQNNLRTDKCGGRFRQLSSLRADRSILGAGGGVIVEGGDNGLRYLESEDGHDSSAERRRLSVQSISMVGSGDCTRDCQAGDDRDVIAGTVDSVREVSVVKEVLSVNEFLTGAPSTSPSSQPSTQPSESPSTSPSISPSSTPSTSPSTSPSNSPSTSPSTAPSSSPSVAPSSVPSTTPSTAPSTAPSTTPSTAPSTSPSTSPSMGPSISVGPSSSPSRVPSFSFYPSVTPSSIPSSTPSLVPSSSPSLSAVPSTSPSMDPSGSIIPSVVPSQIPSNSIIPSVEPSSIPSSTPSNSPSVSINPSGSPSTSPSGSMSPSSQPSLGPSVSAIPSGSPSVVPSGSANPSGIPSTSPSLSVVPSTMPSLRPSSSPSGLPSNLPSSRPSSLPSTSPSGSPSDVPSVSINPSSNPSENPSLSIIPSNAPSFEPTRSTLPSQTPSSQPSSPPSQSPSSFPSAEPSVEPSGSPSLVPTAFPTTSSTCNSALCTLAGGTHGSVMCTVDPPSSDCVCNAPDCLKCIGNNACTSAAGSIGDGSCNGEEACRSLKGSVGENSCNIKNICRLCSENVGDSMCNSQASLPGGCPCLPGSVGSGSCIDGNDEISCYGQNTSPSGITIGIASCTGVDSCILMNLNSIGDGSCTGLQACNGISGNVGKDSCIGSQLACSSAVTINGIGNESCLGQNACTGLDATASVEGATNGVGNGSCTGLGACFGYTGGGIGNSSCTQDSICARCTVIVGDNQCDGVNSCPC